jgi:hypothetical protein
MPLKAGGGNILKLRVYGTSISEDRFVATVVASSEEEA